MRLIVHLKNGTSFLIERPANTNTAETRAMTLLGNAGVVQPINDDTRVVWPIAMVEKITIQQEEV